MKENNITFRTEVFKADIEAVREIVSSTGFFHDYEVPVAVELVEERLQKGVESGYHFVFAEVDGKTAAYSCYGEIPCTNGSYDLYWIVTHNDYRRMGIGKKLLAETEKNIKELGGRGIYVETASKEKYMPTRMFYVQCSYIKEAELKDFYEIGDNKVIYVKYL